MGREILQCVPNSNSPLPVQQKLSEWLHQHPTKRYWAWYPNQKRRLYYRAFTLTASEPTYETSGTIKLTDSKGFTPLSESAYLATTNTEPYQMRYALKHLNLCTTWLIQNRLIVRGPQGEFWCPSHIWNGDRTSWLMRSNTMLPFGEFHKNSVHKQSGYSWNNLKQQSMGKMMSIESGQIEWDHVHLMIYH